MLDFFRKLGFTARDLVLVSFLLVTLAAGLIIKLSGWNKPVVFDYSKTDAEFEGKVNSAYSNFELSPEQQESADRMKTISDSLITEKENNTTLKNGEVPSKKININLALSGDLQLLPGVGEITAERIIEYRESNNGFKSIEEIMNVKGIGIKKFEKIKNLISIN